MPFSLIPTYAHISPFSPQVICPSPTLLVSHRLLRYRTRPILLSPLMDYAPSRLTRGAAPYRQVVTFIKRTTTSTSCRNLRRRRMPKSLFSSLRPQTARSSSTRVLERSLTDCALLPCRGGVQSHPRHVEMATRTPPPSRTVGPDSTTRRSSNSSKRAAMAGSV
jgi:hypothetical protein